MKISTKQYQYIIIGAGIAGLSAIKSIRSMDKTGSILLLSNEDRLPYKRTKLNKHIAAEFTTNDFALHPIDWYKQMTVDILYEEVLSINKEGRTINTKEHQFLYGKLLLSMGAKANIPSISGLDSVPYHFVHYADQVEQIITNSKLKEQYLIIGGGIEALETADQLIKKDKNVTIIQRSKNPLKHLFPETITKKIYDEIGKSNIHYIEEDEVQSVSKIDSHKILIKTKHHQFSVDEIIICAGSQPDLAVINNSTIKYKKGIIVNEYLQTNDDNIYAAGDIAEHANGWITGLWHPAEYQGVAAGKNMAGACETYKEVPYRLKSEFLNHFLFSANYYKVQYENYDPIIETHNEIHRELYASNNQVKAIVMINDKSRSKQYQKAIAEEWSIDKIQKEIPIP